MKNISVLRTTNYSMYYSNWFENIDFKHYVKLILKKVLKVLVIAIKNLLLDTVYKSRSYNLTNHYFRYVFMGASMDKVIVSKAFLKMSFLY